MAKLACETNQQREKGSIIMALDANDSRESKKDSYGEFDDQLDLFPVIDAENAVPSRFDGKRIINHIETYQILPQHLKRRGQTPNGIGFLSDHRGMFVDIHLKFLLGLTPDKPGGSIPWRLKSGNLKTVAAYLTNFKSKLESQNIFQRVSKL